MNRAALMQRIEQHFGAKAVTRAADLAVLLEDICCQVYQWAQGDARAEAARQPAPALPVTVRFALSAEQKNVIRFAAEALEGLDYEDTAGDLRAILAAAAPAAPVAEPSFDQSEFDVMVEKGTKAWAGVPAPRQEPQPVAEQGELQKITDTETARDFLVQWMRMHFSDKTFGFYILKHLAGDFAWNLANAIAASQQAAEPVAPPITPKHIEEIKDLLLWPVTEDAASAARDMLQSLHFDLSMQDAQAPVTQQPQDAIRKLIALHAGELEGNDYAYFELARTRRTGWMAWICTNLRDDDPSRNVLATGQGATPDEACAAAVADYEARAALAKKGAAPSENCDVCAGTGTAFGKTCNCKKGASHG